MNKAQVRRSWDAAAAGWRTWLPLWDASMREVTDTLFELAGVGEGNWLLDVGTGVGEPALTAAGRVGEAGKVVGIDVAKKMVGAAEQRARQAKIAHAAFHELDAADLGKWPEASYDVALSRCAMPWIADRDAALRGIHRVLVRDGVLAASVWSAPDRVPFWSLARDTVAAALGRPVDDDGGAPFSLATPGSLEQALSSAGFGDIRGERMTVVFELESADAYARFALEAMPECAVGLSELGEDEVGKARAALVEAASTQAGPDGKITLTGDVRLVAARKR